MASMITSAGAASGMDFESIISASIELKRSQLESRVTKQKENASIEVSGVGKLKSALEDFQKSIEALTEDNGFNSRKVTTSQSEDNPYFTVSTKDDAANGNYDIDVLQLSSTEKLSKTFNSDETFAAGKLTITVPAPTDEKPDATKSFDVEIEDGYNLEQLRKAINKNDLGVTASIVSTANGDKLVIDSGVSGDDAHFSMAFDTTGDTTKHTDLGTLFTVDTKTATTGATSIGGWSLTQGQDAVIEVDGEEVRSSTNEFDGQISGLTINVNRVTTTKDDNGNTEKNPVNVSITEDTEAVTTKMQNFVTAYNTLLDTMDSLYKHNTYTDGENNYDGGALSGDSMLRSLKTQIQNMMTGLEARSNGLDIYSIGIEFDSDGVMSLDTTKFKDNIKENFNAVVNLFSGEDDDEENVTENDGILLRLNSIIETYTKSNGILDERTNNLNAQIKDFEAQEAENATYLEQYEENLRQRYAKLDTTLANYNNSLNYLYSALS